jgi:hypothetical protein
MVRRTRIFAALGAIAIAVLLMVVLFYEPIEEGRCRLKRRKIGTHDDWLELAGQLLLPLDTRPEVLKDLPMDFNQPRYYEIKSNNKRIPVIVNLSERPTLCMYTNGDGILSQEK